MLSRAAAALGDLIIPRTCAACGTSIGIEERDVCRPCGEELTRAVDVPYCRRCGESRGAYLLHDGQCTRCVTGRSLRRFHSFARVGAYDGALKSLILQFKKTCTLDRLLGSLLAKALRGMGMIDEIDVWVPIPSHWIRRWRVGHQPTAILARAATSSFGGTVEPLLAMRREIPPFHERPGLSSADRARAILGAFSAVPGADLEGRRVCLVDDVMTTGATLHEAKRILREAGARSVSAAVLARAHKGPGAVVTPTVGG